MASCISTAYHIKKLEVGDKENIIDDKRASSLSEYLQQCAIDVLARAGINLALRCKWLHCLGASVPPYHLLSLSRDLSS